MPAVLHAAVGVAAGRATARVHAGRLMLVLALLSMAPDLDVLAFLAGIPYPAPFGHRGAFHSVTVALGIGWLCSLGARQWQLSRLRMFVVVSAVVASHGILDTFTDGGLGIALAWPFSNHRFFFPWRPIPVAPIGRGILSHYGRHVLLVESFVAIPLLLYGLWPRRARRTEQATTRAPPEPPG
jgi:inner membrane protein